MIRIENLYKTYETPHGRFEALRGIDLHVAAGEVFGIIGPSGAGKSTLVQCINLLEQPDHGSVLIGGQMLTGLSESALRSQRRRIGMVFQSFNLLARRTVYGNVALPLEIAGVPAGDIPARVERLLDLVGLAHLRDRYPSQISGGQKQRVGIARAVIGEPRLLVADEPTGNLDPVLSADIMRLLAELPARGTSVMIASHDLSLVKRMKRRVLVLDHGRLLDDIAPEDLADE